MFGRKNKPEPEQGRVLRQVEQGGRSPAFSYYTSRPTDSAERRRPNRGGEGSAQPASKSRIGWKSQLPLWLLLAVGVVCVGKVLLLSTNPKVIVLGANSVSEHYLENKDVYSTAAHKLLASSITSHSKLTIDLDGTAKALEAQFPELQTVSVGLPLIGSRPIVYAQLAQPSVVLQTPGANYALNKSGVVLAKVQGTPSGAPVVVDQSGLKPVAGKQVLPSSTVTFVRTVAYQLQQKQIAVSAFVLPAGSPYELDIRLEAKAYTIRCNLVADSLNQSGAIVATLEQLGDATPNEYLDIRVPGRVYYK